MFILSILNIIEIYYSTNVLYQIKHSHKKAQTIIIFTIINSIITNSFLCTIHFHLSIISWNESMSLTFSIISLIYFILISFIEINIYYYKLQAKYISISETNPSSFKRKLFIISALVYILIVTCVIFSKEILTHFPLCFVDYFMTWV